MASIVKRKKKFSVVYTYTDEKGVKRQRWETFNTNAEAKKRKTQVEFQQNTGTFIPPVAKTGITFLEIDKVLILFDGSSGICASCMLVEPIASALDNSSSDAGHKTRTKDELVWAREGW